MWKKNTISKQAFLPPFAYDLKNGGERQSHRKFELREWCIEICKGNKTNRTVVKQERKKMSNTFFSLYFPNSSFLFIVVIKYHKSIKHIKMIILKYVFKLFLPHIICECCGSSFVISCLVTLSYKNQESFVESRMFLQHCSYILLCFAHFQSLILFIKLFL